MNQLEPIQLEEHAGQRFYVEFVSYVAMGYWFRIHMVNSTHTFTVESDGTIDEARKEVIRSFKEYLDEHTYYSKPNKVIS